MGFKESLMKVIGMEEIDDDEIVTEQELEEAKKKIVRETEKETKIMPSFKKPEPVNTNDRMSSSSSYSRGTEKRFSVTNTSSLKLILIEPKGYEDCTKLVDCLKARKPVIINLERLETESARKIFDFLSGATYALNGNVQKIANNIFIFTPENVAVSAQQPSISNVADVDDKNPWR
ncbi:MAG: cell division protein SepF [Eubacterium sp.]|nr:cell division protein SepF [Eubacterium sp.]